MEGDYKVVKVDMKNEEQYNIVHHIRKTFIDDLGDNHASLIQEDELTDIYLLYFKGIALATLRLHKKELGWKIERVASLKEYRHQGHTKYLMQHAADYLLKPVLKEGEIIYLYSQIHAIGFYEKCGFVCEGEEFLDEDNIPHIKMVFKL